MLVRELLFARRLALDACGSYLIVSTAFVGQERRYKTNLFTNEDLKSRTHPIPTQTQPPLTSIDTMRFFLAILAVALGHVVNATPVIVATESTGVTTLAASFPVSELSIESSVHSNTTLAGRALHGLAARQEFPANLLLCPTLNCASCLSFTTQAQAENTCFNAGFVFDSAAISQPSNQGLPFAVLVGTPGCAALAQIPTVNECFNLNGGPFTTFAFLP